MTETAETLRRAAKLMRDRADGVQTVTPGPWRHDSLGWGYPQPVYDSGGELAAEAYSGPLTAAGVAQHVASWHPLVARAVADWLDEVADDHHPELPAWVDDGALRIARAYLGHDL